ncbi:MAG: MATE family efflux transporter [Planctomycetota bacterium]
MSDKSLFQLSYPLLLSALVGMIVMLLDMVIISAYSENAAAAVSIANQILLVAFDFSAILATGAVVLIPRFLGAKEDTNARFTTQTGIIASGMVSLMLGVIVLVAAPMLIKAINCPAEILGDATTYLRVGSLTIVFNGVMMMSTAVLRGYGETLLVFLLGVFAYALYLICEYVFIFGLWIIPELGVLGSALATLLVRVTAVVALLVVLAKRLRAFEDLKQFDFKSASQRAKEMFHLSWPGAVDNLGYGFYQMILVSFIAAQSVAMLLARTFTLSLTAMLTVVLMSISQGNEVMVGYRVGAGREDQINRCVIQASIASTVLTMSLAVLFYLFSDTLLRLFTTQREVLELGRSLLGITVFVQPFSAVNTILFHSLKARGDVRVPVLATQLMMWFLSVPLAYWLAVVIDHGVIGLWYVLLFEEALKAGFLFLRWKVLGYEGTV